MSHFTRVAAAVSLAVACSSSKPAVAPDTAPAVTGEGVVGAPTSDVPGTEASAGAEGSVATGVQPLFVADQLADCQGEGARKCLRVRSSPSEEWRSFFGVIDGFDYEPSYTYELRVEVTPLANPPADAPSLRYRLVEVVSKQRVAE
jgi:uncharacterized protein DUF4377